MKCYLFILTFFGASLSLLAQHEAEPVVVPEDDPTISFAVVNKVPHIEGCEEDLNSEEARSCFQQALLEHVSKNFRFPRFAAMRGISGRIYLNFVIQKDGSISNLQVVRGLENSIQSEDRLDYDAARQLDNEALRVVSSLKIAGPALLKGKPVKMSFTLPINAKLQ